MSWHPCWFEKLFLGEVQYITSFLNKALKYKRQEMPERIQQSHIVKNL